ncbi:Hypothetical_protein [Hexamita inflata]|uniref:Hypothetical_protein n=1 Tax=Hexamita inflata TaxID=28002 RepID=A0ABP1GXE5_9EUKA
MEYHILLYVSVNEIKLNLLMQYSALFSQYSPKSQTRSNAVFVIFQRSSTGLNQLIKLCIYNTQYCRSLHRYDSSQSVEGDLVARTVSIVYHVTFYRSISFYKVALTLKPHDHVSCVFNIQQLTALHKVFNFSGGVHSVNKYQ